jgi:hypothetical protein
MKSEKRLGGSHVGQTKLGDESSTAIQKAWRAVGVAAKKSPRTLDSSCADSHSSTAPSFGF